MFGLMRRINEIKHIREESDVRVKKINEETRKIEREGKEYVERIHRENKEVIKKIDQLTAMMKNNASADDIVNFINNNPLN